MQEGVSRSWRLPTYYPHGGPALYLSFEVTGHIEGPRPIAGRIRGREGCPKTDEKFCNLSSLVTYYVRVGLRLLKSSCWRETWLNLPCSLPPVTCSRTLALSLYLSQAAYSRVTGPLIPDARKIFTTNKKNKKRVKVLHCALYFAAQYIKTDNPAFFCIFVGYNKECTSTFMKNRYIYHYQRYS